MTTNGYYHTLTDEELINYVDNHPSTDLERELADRLDVLRLDNESLRIDILNMEQELADERAV